MAGRNYGDALPRFEKPVKRLTDRIAFESCFKSSSKTLRSRLLNYIQSIDPIVDSETMSLPNPTITEVNSKVYNEPESKLNDFFRKEIRERLGASERAETLITRIEAVLEIFGKASTWIDEIPLENRTEMRFGNKTFRKWHAKLTQEAPEICRKILPEEKYGNACDELLEYFLVSFGDPTRIDYGTGHECSFLCGLYCLEIGYSYFDIEERNFYVTILFANYMCLMRKLQAVYVLEPAGSHGVWGLDDFQHLIFIFGAKQVLGYNSKVTGSEQILVEQMEKRAQHRPVSLCRYELFAAAVRNIFDTKRGAPFSETSPQLSSALETVPNWERVYGGMVKMYVGEVLEKFPVIQHFLFGTTLPYE